MPGLRVFPQAPDSMEGQHLQARVAGPRHFPVPLLHPQPDVPPGSGRATENSVRGRGQVLRGVQRPDPALLRAGLLHLHHHAALVGPVHQHTLAGPHRRLCQLPHPRPGRAWAAHAAHHHAVRVPLPHDGLLHDLAQSQDALPHAGALCGGWSPPGEREGHHPRPGREVPSALEALAADRVGGVHRDEGAARGPHPGRLRVKDHHRRAQQVQRAVRHAPQLRLDQRAPRVHPSGHSGCVLVLHYIRHSKAMAGSDPWCGHDYEAS